MGNNIVVEVNINGKVFKLSGQESPEYYQRVASYLNKKISELQINAGFNELSGDYKNMLVNLNIADDYFKALDRLNALERDVEEKNKEIYDLKHDVVNQELELEELKKRNRNGI